MCGIHVKFTSAFLFAVDIALLLPYLPGIYGLVWGDGKGSEGVWDELEVLDHSKKYVDLDGYWRLAICLPFM